MKEIFRITGLFAVTAVAEILGCYLFWLVLKLGKSAWLLILAAVSLTIFAWLLTLHPSAAGRTYAAYGGMYINSGTDVAALGRWGPAHLVGSHRCEHRADWDGCDRTTATRVMTDWRCGFLRMTNDPNQPLDPSTRNVLNSKGRESATCGLRPEVSGRPGENNGP